MPCVKLHILNGFLTTYINNIHRYPICHIVINREARITSDLTFSIFGTRRIRNMQVIDTLGAACASTQKSGSESQHLSYHMNSGKEYLTLFCNLI